MLAVVRVLCFDDCVGPDLLKVRPFTTLQFLGQILGSIYSLVPVCIVLCLWSPTSYFGPVSITLR